MTRTDDRLEIEELLSEYVRDKRYEDAANVCATLAAAHREQHYVARTHYFRGMVLLEGAANTEARHELRRALAIDPSLDEARQALDAMTTTKLQSL